MEFQKHSGWVIGTSEKLLLQIFFFRFRIFMALLHDVFPEVPEEKGETRVSVNPGYQLHNEIRRSNEI